MTKFPLYVRNYYGHFVPYNPNAYGTILIVDEDGAFPVTCGHGGSEWLCIECANDILPLEKNLSWEAV